MKILGLPGINPATGQWMKKLLGSIDLNQSEITIQKYQSWTNPVSRFNLEVEAGIAAKAKPDMVIAKSIGIRVALFAFSNNLIAARSYILLGIPVRGCAKEEISALKELSTSVPTLLIQQTDDPAGSFSVLASPICKTSEIPGNDHLYGNIKQLRQIIESWHTNIGG
jgi:predicted alpha/beta-hydrolase family hydrolase